MFTEVTHCRCCGKTDLYQYLDLGHQPLANSYHKGEQLPLFPLCVNLCQECFHSQLNITVDPTLLFDNYLYVSGTTSTFRNHCKELAHEAINFWNSRYPFLMTDCWRPPTVLDIACNDGTLLNCFRKQDCNVYGVDPAKNLRTLTKEKDIHVDVLYWGKGAASQLKEQSIDIITGTNVFAHINPIGDFLDECLTVLKPDGFILLEFPYCDEMIENNEFDTIYHEHLSYFLVNSMATIISSHGLAIRRITRTPIHGGSIRFYLQRGNKHCDEVTTLIDSESNRGLLDIKTYQKFSEQVERNKQHLRSLVADLKGRGKKVVGYGASAKGNTMLNYFEIDLDYIVDDNEMKWNHLTPGRNIPIKSPAVMKKEKELYIVILAWNFFDEIKERIESTCDNKHHYLRYVPFVEIS